MLKALMILLLFNCFLNLQANDTNISPFTGKQEYKDTCICIPIDNIRSANDKMIERKYLIKINLAKDSIISLNNDYILQQDTIIQDLKDRIIKVNKINEDLQNQYKKEKTKKIIYGSVAGAVIVGAAASIITILVMK